MRQIEKKLSFLLIYAILVGTVISFCPVAAEDGGNSTVELSEELSVERPAGSEDDQDLVKEYTFDGENAASDSAAWGIGSDDNIIVSTSADDDTYGEDYEELDGSYMRIEGAARQYSSGVWIDVTASVPLASENGPVQPDTDFTIQFDVCYDVTPSDVSTVQMMMVMGEGFWNGMVMDYKRGLLQNATGNVGAGDSIALDPGKWHQVTVAYHEESNSASIYIGDEDTGIVMQSRSDTKPEQLFFGVQSSVAGKAMRVDNIKIYGEANETSLPSPTPTGAPSPEQSSLPITESLVKEYTFDGENAASDSAAWGIGSDDNIIVSTSADDDTYGEDYEELDGSYMRIEGAARQYSSGVWIDVTASVPLASENGPVQPDTDFTIQFDVCYDVTPSDVSTVQMMMVMGEGFWNGMVMDYKRGLLQNATGNVGAGDSIALDPGKWHQVTVAYHEESNSASIYIGDEDTGIVMQSRSDTKPEQLFFGVQSSVAGKAMRVDNIKIYDRHFAYVGSSLPDGYTKVPAKGMEVTLHYVTPVTDSAARAVYMTDAAGQQTAIDTTIENGKIVIRTPQTLTPGAEYTITVPAGILDVYGKALEDATTYRFTVADETLVMSKPEISSTAAATPTVITVTTQGENLDIQARSGILSVAQYDTAGRMLALTEKGKVFEPGESRDISLFLTPKADAAVVCAFVRDGRDENKLLREDFAALGTDVQSERFFLFGETVQNNLTVTASDLDGNGVTICGSSSGAGLVLIQIFDPQEAQLLTVPLYPDADGSYSYPYTFSADAANGVYTVYVQNADGEMRNSVPLHFLQEDERAVLLRLANSKMEADQEALETLLDRNKEILGLKQGQSTGMAQTLQEQGPYASYEEAHAKLKAAVALLEKLNSTNWDGMSALLRENHNMIFYQNADYAAYTGLSGSNQNLINQEIIKGMPVTDFAAFRNLFGEVMAAWQSGDLDPQTGNSGLGGGGSSNRGEGGAGDRDSGGMTVRFDQNVVSQYAAGADQNKPEAENTDVFIDLETSAWAKESIWRLYDLGVISPAADQQFRPEDAVAREELVKMLTVAFGLELSSADSGFIDVESGAWYQPYLAAAKAAGIVEGNPDGSFGIGQPVTRQDMATMAYRTVQALNRSLQQNNSVEVFADSGEIADYAGEAVAAMQRAGIINGMGDGTFRPMEYSSRAQAAKVVAGLLDSIK